MKARVLTGSKREIAESVSRIDGDVREAIVFINEPPPPEPSRPITPNVSGAGRPAPDIFAEMEPFCVRHGNADDSRDAIYRRVENE